MIVMIIASLFLGLLIWEFKIFIDYSNDYWEIKKKMLEEDEEDEEDY